MREVNEANIEQIEKTLKFDVISMTGEAFYKMLRVHNFIAGIDKDTIRKTSIDDIIKATNINKDEMDALFKKVCTMNQQYNKDKVICEKLAMIEQKLIEEKQTKEDMIKKLPRGRPKGVLTQKEELKRELEEVKKLKAEYIENIKQMTELTKQSKEALYELNTLKNIQTEINTLKETKKDNKQELEQESIEEAISDLNLNNSKYTTEKYDEDAAELELNELGEMESFLNNINKKTPLKSQEPIEEEVAEEVNKEEEENASLRLLKQIREKQREEQNRKKNKSNNNDPILRKMIKEDEDEDEDEDEEKLNKRKTMSSDKTEMGMIKMLLIILSVVIGIAVAVIGGMRLYNQSQKLDVQVPDTNITQTQQVPALTPPPPAVVNEVNATIKQLNSNNTDTVLNENALYKDIDNITTFDEFQKAIDNNQIKVADNELIVGDRVYAAGDSIGKNFTYVKQYSDGQIKIYSKKEHFAKKFKIQ